MLFQQVCCPYFSILALLEPQHRFNPRVYHTWLYFFLLSLQLWPRIWFSLSPFWNYIRWICYLLVCSKAKAWKRGNIFIVAHYSFYSSVLNISQHATIILTLFQLCTDIYRHISHIFSIGLDLFSSKQFAFRNEILCFVLDWISCFSLNRRKKMLMYRIRLQHEN